MRPTLTRRGAAVGRIEKFAYREIDRLGARAEGAVAAGPGTRQRRLARQRLEGQL